MLLVRFDARAQVTIREHVVISPRNDYKPVSLNDYYYESACYQRTALSCYSNVMPDGVNSVFTVDVLAGIEYVRLLLSAYGSGAESGTDVGSSVTYDASQNSLWLVFDKASPVNGTVVHLSITPANATDNVSYEDVSIIGNPSGNQGRANYADHVVRGNPTDISPYIYMECPETIPETDSLVATLVEGSEYGSIYNSSTGSHDSPVYLGWMSEGWFTWLVNGMETYESLGFQANRAIPDVAGPVRVRFSSLHTTVAPWEVRFNVTPNDSVSAQPIPAVAYTGDTVAFSLQNKKQILGGVLQPFPDSARFTARILVGSDYGGLLAAGDTMLASELHGVPAGFQLVPAGTIPEDSVQIGLLITADGVYPSLGSPQGKSGTSAHSFSLVPLSGTSREKPLLDTLLTWLPKGQHAVRQREPSGLAKSRGIDLVSPRTVP